LKKILLILVFFSLAGGLYCQTPNPLSGWSIFEWTLDAGVSYKGFELSTAMGINKEDDFNLLLMFGYAFYYPMLSGEEPDTVSTEDDVTGDAKLALYFEKYFSDKIGLGVYAGVHRLIEEPYPRPQFMAGVTLPISWAYGKITPFAEYLMDDVHGSDFNFGVRFSLRNQMAAIAVIAFGEATPPAGHRRYRYRDPVDTADAALAIVGFFGLPVEDFLPYPAWKYNPYWAFQQPEELIKE
jgi:hypothetical protein